MELLHLILYSLFGLTCLTLLGRIAAFAHLLGGNFVGLKKYLRIIADVCYFFIKA